MPFWMILVRDALLIVMWELIRSGDRVKEKERVENVRDN